MKLPTKALSEKDWLRVIREEEDIIYRLELFLSYSPSSTSTYDAMVLREKLSKTRNRLKYYQHMQKTVYPPSDPLRDWLGNCISS